MRYVSICLRSVALFSIGFFLISCQKQLSLEAGLPIPSQYNVRSIPDTEFPGVVKVRAPSERDSDGNITRLGGMCSGTIVSDRAVLTAAHCTLNTGTYRVSGGFGEAVSTSLKVNFGPGVVDDPNDLSVLIFDAGTFEPENIVSIGVSVRTGDTATLVGYGCDNITTEAGAGFKRMGTNQVARLNAYVEFYTPVTASNFRGIIGPDNRAGSCPGDSGGPALKETNGVYEVVAVTHAGGVWGRTIISQYVDLTRSDNRGFISQVNSDYDLGIEGF